MILENCPAPAKLNLFLHVVGRRADGYHNLQSVFELIDWCDQLHFEPRSDGIIRRTSGAKGVPEADDLVVRAAKALQCATGCTCGANIGVEKHIPMGAGLGGGSSDAATTLIALNKLWGLGLSREHLIQIGRPLGADIPFFIFGRRAFVQGTGDILDPLPFGKSPRYFVVAPPVEVATQLIFQDKYLTRDTPEIKISDLPECCHSDVWSFGKNDLQAVTARLFSEVDTALAQLRNQFGPLTVRMSGSGSACFVSLEKGHEVLASTFMGNGVESRFVCGLESHPLYEWLAVDNRFFQDSLGSRQVG